MDNTINLAKIEDFLFNCWKFPTPKLIMSVIGGSSEFTLDDRLEAKFVNGIVNVVVRSGLDKSIVYFSQRFDQFST